MDSTEPDFSPYQNSPADRGKRAAQSPAPSPSKALLYKRQHWGELEESKSTQESLAALPASDQPASEYTLKLMLKSPQKDLRNELRSSLSSLHFRVDQIEERTDMLERQVTEHTTAHHEASEAYHQHSQEIQFLQAKVTDLEDRSRRNNIKFRGIPETIKPPDLIHYIQQLFLKLIPQLSQADRETELPTSNGPARHAGMYSFLPS